MYPVTSYQIISIIQFLKDVIIPISQQLPIAELKKRLEQHQWLLNTPHNLTDEYYKELCYLASKKIQDILDQSLGDPIYSILKKINTICQIFCLRSSKLERYEIEESTEVKQLIEKAINLMRIMDFHDPIYPLAKKKHYDIAIIWGCHELQFTKRINHLISLLKSNYSFSRIAFLSGFRQINLKTDPATFKEQNTFSDHFIYPFPELSSEPLSEFDMIIRLYSKLYKNNTLPSQLIGDITKLGITSFNTKKILYSHNISTLLSRTRNTYILSIATPEKTIIDFVNGSPLVAAGTLSRSTTLSTVEDYLGFLFSEGIVKSTSKNSHKRHICSISTQPYAWQQATVAEKVLSDYFYIYPTAPTINKSSTSDIADNLARFIYQQLENVCKTYS